MAQTIDKYVLETSVTGLKEVDALNTSVSTLGKSIDSVTSKRMAITVNSEGLSGLSTTVKGIETSLNTIAGKTVNPNISLAGVEQLNATLNNLVSSINQLGGKVLNINTDSDQVNAAKREVDDLGRAIDKVDDKDINVKAEVGGGILGQNIDELKTSFNNLTSNIATGALAALAALGVNAVNSAGQLSDLSSASDITTSRLLWLKEAFIKAGGDGDTFAEIVNKLMDAVNEAASGNTKFIDAFKALNVPIKDVNGEMRSTTDILRSTIKALSIMEDNTKRQTLATDLFGKSLKGLEFKNKEFKLIFNDKELNNHIDKVDKIGESWDLLKVKLERDSFALIASGADDATKALERLSRVLASLMLFMENASNLVGGFGNKLENLMPIIKVYNKLADAIENVDKARAGDANAPWWAKQFSKVEKMLGYGGATPRQQINEKLGELDSPSSAVGLPDNTSYNDYQFGTPKDSGAAKAAADNAKAEQEARDKARLAMDAEMTALKAASKMKLEAIQQEGALLGLSSKAASENRAAIEIQNNLKRDYLQIDAQILLEKQKGAKADQYIIDKLKEQKTIVNSLASDLLDQVTANSEVSKGIDEKNRLLKAQYDAVAGISKLEDSDIKTAGIQKEIDKHTEALDQYTAQYNALVAIGEEQGLLSQAYLTAAENFSAYNEIWMLGMDNQRLKIEELRRAEKERSESFAGGWEDAIKRMVESFKPAQLGAQAFNDLWGNISSSIDTAVTTGKFKFADFRDSVIRDIAAMMAKAAASKIIGTLLGTAISAAVAPASIGGNAAQGLQLPRAKGGSVGGGEPYMVGERGPELFMPGQNGTIIPTRNLQAETKPQVVNNYTYNVSAVDGQSVARFFMENKNLAAAAVNSARKERG